MSILSYFKPISAALLPNAEFDDIKLVLSMFLPWNWNKWQDGKEIGELENKFKEYFGVKHAISFSSGRVGLYAILFVIASPEFIEGRGNSADGAVNTGLLRRSAPRNDNSGEIILQAYTTIALPLAIKKADFTPVYVDIKEDTYNIDPEKIEAKITPRTKAIIVQHTFGVPSEMDKILEICKKHHLFLIEDCAHSLGAEFNSRKVGTFGDAAFFSFGRDKIISSTSGGMVITNNDDLAKKIKEFQNNLPFPPAKWIFKQLLHPLVFAIALPIYYFFNLGKYLIYFSQKIGLIGRAYSREEKEGNIDSPCKIISPETKFPPTGISQGELPNILAILALNQFKKLERFNNHRQKIAEIYDNLFHYDNSYYHSEINIDKTDKNSFHYHTLEYDSKVKNFKNEKKISHFDYPNYQSKIKLPKIAAKSKPSFLYYTIQIDRRDELLNLAAKKHIILGDWFPGALGPRGINEEKFGYRKGDCPIAEHVGLKSLNLPANIKTSEKDAEKVAEIIKEFLDKK